MVGNQREWPTDGHKGIGMNNRDNPDPLDEANVYLAYGRTEQAAKILEQAIREEPTRRDCQRLLDQMQTAKNSPRHFLNSLDTATRNHSSTSVAESKVQEFYEESVALRRNGLPEEQVVARLERRLQDFDKQLENDLTVKIAEIRARFPQPTRLKVPQRFRIPFLIVLLIVLGGAILEETLGTHFIFTAMNQYRAAMPWIIGVLTPLFGLLIFRVERVNHDLSGRFPTWWIRWLVMFPLMAVLSSLAVAWAPLGWSALFGWALGSSVEQFEAKVVYVSKPSSRGCRQNAEIEFNGTSKLICLADVLVGRVPISGEIVRVVGLRSNLGTYIEEIHAK